MEKLSCLNCRLIIVGDFNINWLDSNDSERKQFYILLQTFGLVQRIDMPTYQNGHLLDYIITRESGDFASNFRVSNEISDHMALQVSLACQRLTPRGTKSLLDLCVVHIRMHYLLGSLLFV